MDRLNHMVCLDKTVIYYLKVLNMVLRTGPTHYKDVKAIFC